MQQLSNSQISEGLTLVAVQDDGPILLRVCDEKEIREYDQQKAQNQKQFSLIVAGSVAPCGVVLAFTS